MTWISDALNDCVSPLCQDMRKYMPWISNQLAGAVRKGKRPVQDYLVLILMSQFESMFRIYTPQYPGEVEARWLDEFGHVEDVLTTYFHYAVVLCLGLRAPAFPEAHLPLKTGPVLFNSSETHPNVIRTIK